MFICIWKKYDRFLFSGKPWCNNAHSHPWVWISNSLPGQEASKEWQYFWKSANPKKILLHTLNFYFTYLSCKMVQMRILNALIAKNPTYLHIFPVNDEKSSSANRISRSLLNFLRGTDSKQSTCNLYPSYRGMILTHFMNNAKGHSWPGGGSRRSRSPPAWPIQRRGNDWQHHGWRRGQRRGHVYSILAM